MAQLKDLIVNGATRLVGKVYTSDIQITSIKAPSASNGTTYTAGTSGQVLKSNGTSVYWAADASNSNSYHTTGSWGGTNNLTYTATAVGGAGALAFTLATATTQAYGVTKLNTTTNSTSTTEAATPSAVKAAYDLAASKTNNTGTVTSITIKTSSPLTGGSDTAVTTSGTWTVGFATQNKNLVLASSTNTNATTPTFRALVADDIPTLTKSKISDFPTSMTPTSHTHGNLTNDGKITTTATIASGDKLVIVDSDSTAASKITGSSITFGSSANYALANNGTWQAFNNYSHPTTSGNKHIPSGGSSGQFLGWAADGTAAWVANPNSHYATHLYAGNATAQTGNQTATNGNTYLRLYDDTTAREAIKITGAGAATVTASSGTITVNATNTTYTFANGSNGSFTVTPAGGTAQTVSVGSSALPSDNITGEGTSNHLAIFDDTHAIADGPAMGSSTATFLRNDGTWATPSIPANAGFVSYAASQNLTDNQKLTAQTNVGLSKIIAQQVSVTTAAWGLTQTYLEYPYRATISMNGVSAAMVPEVVFHPDDVSTGNYAPVADVGANMVYIYAKTIPYDTITIPTIIVEGIPVLVTATGVNF